MRLSAAGDSDQELNLKSSNDRFGKDFGMERSSKALIQAYGGISGVGGRRYMTMPAPLSTILESSDDMPSYSESNDAKGSAVTDLSIPSVIESDLAASTALSKQMRRPKVVKGTGIVPETCLQPNIARPASTTSDDILASMDAYLDNLSSLEGLTSTSRLVSRAGAQ